MYRNLAALLLLLCALAVLLTVPGLAQVQIRPTDPPLVTAVNESWYQLREPVQFAGDLYFPAGPAVFFDGNVMVRTGHYNGVPLYANTTLEPYSVVLVPVSRGLMQPYERRRQGALASTTGSRTPSFPGRIAPREPGVVQSATAPTMAPLPLGAIPAYTPEPALPVDVGAAVARATARRDSGLGIGGSIPGVVGTTGVSSVRRNTPLVSLRRPESNDGLWLQFGGEKWVADGTAVAFDAAGFVRVGEHAGFPVYTRAGFQEEVIYLPTRAELVAPYRLKE